VSCETALFVASYRYCGQSSISAGRGFVCISHADPFQTYATPSGATTRMTSSIVSAPMSSTTMSRTRFSTYGRLSPLNRSADTGPYTPCEAMYSRAAATSDASVSRPCTRYWSPR